MSLLTRILLWGLYAVALAPVYGTLVPHLSFEQLVGESEAVIHGRVETARVAWDASHDSIWTHYEVHVNDALKGSVGPLVTIQEPGGELDGVRMEVVGAPTYEIGEEIVVFAARTPLGLRTCGWGQGRFVVSGNAGGKQVRNDLGAVQLISPKGKTLPERAASSVDEGLNAFKRRIRNEVLRQDR